MMLDNHFVHDWEDINKPWMQYMTKSSSFDRDRFRDGCNKILLGTRKFDYFELAVEKTI